MITRRGLLSGVAAATVLASPSARPQAARSDSSRTFVFVHGGWHGGWCWRRVADQLRKLGHRVFTPTLTGLGERSHLMSENIHLETHITDVVNVLKWEDLKDVTLVGHSYGGSVISGVAEHSGSAIGTLVFLDAFVPENGEAIVDLASQNVRDSINAARSRGETSLPPLPAANFRVNEADRAWVDSKCTSHPIFTLLDKARLTGARERIARKTYIRATGYPSASFEAAHQRLKGNPAWRVQEIPSGHDVMIDMPERLTRVLLAG